MESLNKGNNGGKASERHSEIEIMKWFIIKEKLICQELNKLQDEGEIVLRGLFWCPKKYREILELKIIDIRSK